MAAASLGWVGRLVWVLGSVCQKLPPVGVAIGRPAPTLGLEEASLWIGSFLRKPSSEGPGFLSLGRQS